MRLWSDAATDASPAWSRDGSRIVFATDRGDVPGKKHIAVMQADGQGITVIAVGVSPSWSRDGTKIVFARADSMGLSTINPDGTGLTRLTTGRDHAPAWRP
jgi:Tol biopolymer transport system component